MATYSYTDANGQKQTATGVDANQAFASIKNAPAGLNPNSLENGLDTSQPTPATASSTTPTPAITTGITGAGVPAPFGSNTNAAPVAAAPTTPASPKAPVPSTQTKTDAIPTNTNPLSGVQNAVYAAVKTVDPSNIGAVQSAAASAINNVGASPVVDPIEEQIAPFVTQLSQAMQAILAPTQTYQSLTQQYQQIAQSSGLNGLNTSVMNLQNIMQGTDSDIRDEITASGGFADESQVQAMATARNTVLQTQLSSLQAQQAVAQNYVQNTMQYATQDQSEQDTQQQLALSKINDASGIVGQIASLQQTMTKNAQGNYQSLISYLPNGIAGLATLLSGDPTQLSYAESTLGLPSGSLSDPNKIQAIQLQSQNASLQKQALSIFSTTGAYPSWYDASTGGVKQGTTINPDGTIADSGTSGDISDVYSGGTVIGGIDFGDVPGVGAYATDISSETSGVGAAYNTLTNGNVSIGQYIQNNAPNSPVTADMINNAANANGIDPNILAATLANESNFGTKGAGAKTKNPGNVGNTDSGSTKTMSSWQDGVNATAEQLARRVATSTPIVSPAVAGWVANIQSGGASIGSVPTPLKTAVSNALASSTGTYGAGSVEAQRAARLGNTYNTQIKTIMNTLYASGKNPIQNYNSSAQVINRLENAYQDSKDPKNANKGADDLDLLDSYVQIARPGQQVTEAQIDTLLGSFGVGAKWDVANQKFTGTATLDDGTRDQIYKLANQTFGGQKKLANQAVTDVNSKLKAESVPSTFLLQSPSDASSALASSDSPPATPKGSMSDGDYVESTLDAQNISYSTMESYNQKLSASGQFMAINNSTGEILGISQSEYSAGGYTKI